MNESTAISGHRSAIGKLLDALIKHGTLPNMPIPDLIRDAQMELATYDIGYAALLRERDAYRSIVNDVRSGNYDNAHDITAARKYIYNTLDELGLLEKATLGQAAK